MDAAITIHIDADTKGQLDRLAKTTSKSESTLIIEALREYLAVNEWQIQAIEEGVRQADAGELIPHEDIRKKWETKLAHTMD